MNETFKTRLLIEQEDLHEKIVKLNDFMNSDKAQSIAEAQRILLGIQLQVMRTYEHILAQRITILG